METNEMTLTLLDVTAHQAQQQTDLLDQIDDNARLTWYTVDGMAITMRRFLIVAVILLSLIAALLAIIAFRPLLPVLGADTGGVTVTEDMEGWDCRTMGNGRCVGDDSGVWIGATQVGVGTGCGAEEVIGYVDEGEVGCIDIDVVKGW